MIIQLPTWQTVRRSPQVRQLLQILQLLLQHILAFLQKLQLPQYARTAVDYVTPHIQSLGTTLYNEIPPLPEFPPEYRELLLLPQKLAELPQHIPDYAYPSYWKAVYDDLPPLPAFMYPSWWRELYNGLPGWLFPSYYKNLALDAILKIWSIYIGFLASRDTSRDIEDSPQELYDTLNQTRDAAVELLQEEALPPKQVSQAPQAEVLVEEEEEELGQQSQDEETGVWSVETANGGKGLSRYAGVESLVELSDGTAPIVPPPVQTRPRHSMVLSSIPDTPEQPRPSLPPLDVPEKPDISTTEDEFEDVSESSDKDKEGIWASLVSKYAEPEKPKKEKSRELSEDDLDDGPEYVGTADEIVKRYTAKSAVSLDLDEDEDDGRPMTDDDFTKVGLRLEEYLSRIEDDEDVPASTSKVKRVDKIMNSKEQVANNSKMVSLKKEKPQEKVESIEDEVSGDDIEREPTMEDIEAELRRLEEMEAEIALMEQKENKTLQPEVTETNTASETPEISKVEILDNKLASGDIVERLQNEMSRTLLNLSDKISGSKLSEESINKISAMTLEIDEPLDKYEAEIPKDMIKSKQSEGNLGTGKYTETLETALSDGKLSSDYSGEIAESGELDKEMESQLLEEKIENEAPEIIELEISDTKNDSQLLEDKVEYQQEKPGSEVSKDELETELSEDKLQSEASVDKLESEKSENKLISEESDEKLESQVSEEMLDSQVSDFKSSQASEDKLKSQILEDMQESPMSEVKLESQASEDMLVSQLSDDKLEAELSEGMVESDKSDGKIESEGSVEYSETTESESEPITQLQGEKITIELSASVTDSGSIRGFFTNLWNRADNQQMVEKTFEKTLTSESKQEENIEGIQTVITTVEKDLKKPEIDVSEKTSDPASIKDFFQSLWTRADNHVNLEKVKENVILQNEEVNKVKEIITEESLLNGQESKPVIETEVDEMFEEEPEVSVEVIVKPEDKPVPKSILKKPSIDLPINPQEKTFEMKVEELKAEIGEKPHKTSPVSTEDKTFEMKVKELKADMMDRSTFKKPFIDDLEKEKTFEMKIEDLKSQMEEVETEVHNKNEEITADSEFKCDFSEVSTAKVLLETNLDESIPENICEEESKDLIEIVQAEPEQTNTEVSDEFNLIKTSVSIETEHGKEGPTAVSELDNTGVTVIEVVDSTVTQTDIDQNNLSGLKEETDIKAEICEAMEETEVTEVKVDSEIKDIPEPEEVEKEQDKIEEEIKKGIKEAETSNSSTKRPPMAAWRGNWSQATLDDVGDFETEAVVDDSIRDLSKRKGSTISDSGSVKGFFENLWKCAEVEGIKTKSSLDSKSRSESIDAGSLLESSNEKKESDSAIGSVAKQSEITESGKVPEVPYLSSQEATSEEVTAAAVMTEFWGRRIEESDDEDILIKQNALEKEVIPETDFWNRKILEDSSAEKETSAPEIKPKKDVSTEDSTPISDFWNRKILGDSSSVEKEFSAQEITQKSEVSTEDSTSISDFWNRKILEDSSVEKESSAAPEGFWGAVDKMSKEGEDIKTIPEVSTEDITPISDFWNRKILEDSSVEKESPAAPGGFWGEIDKMSKGGEEILTIQDNLDKQEATKDETMEIKQKGTSEEITPATNFWSLKQQESSSIEKEDSAPADGFWYSINKPSNESDEVLSSITDYWGSKPGKLKTLEGHSDIPAGLTKGEEMELKDYLEQKNGCDTDTGSMDIGSIKELDKTIGKYSPMTVSSVEKEDSVPKHLEDVEDLLVPARPPRSKKSSPINVDDDIDMEAADPYMRKYMEMPANLTEDEEMELREYMEQHKEEGEELSLERYLEMNPDLTEEEKADYEELLLERQAMREREQKELAKYLDMPVGLTEEEKQELEMLEKEEGDEGEEWNEAANFRELLDMPADLTEEELRILQEDQGDEEMEFEDEEAYRQYIRQKFLMQLDEEAYAAYDDDEGGYGYETEYEGDAEYDEEYDEEMEGEYVMVDEEEDADISEQQKESMIEGSSNTDSVFKKTKRIFGFKKSSNENSVEGSPASGKKFRLKKGSSEEKSKEESPGASKKKGFMKLGTKDTSEEGSPAPAKKKFGFPKLVTKESNEPGSPATQKKFFRFGSLGTKKKKGISNENLEKAESGNSYTVGICTIERDLQKMTECFSDFNNMDNLKEISFNTLKEGNKKYNDKSSNAELCKSLSENLSNLLLKEKSKTMQHIDSSLLSTSRIKPECEIPEVFLYSPPAGDTKDQRDVISPGEEDLDFWYQWQSEEKATVRLSNEWVDDLDVIEEESELGEDLDVIYEESEEEYNFEDIARRNSDSGHQQVKREIRSNNESENKEMVLENENKPTVNDYTSDRIESSESPSSANLFVKKTSKLESSLLPAREHPLNDQCNGKSVKRENSEEEINKGLERISEEIYELTEESEDFDWWGHINFSENQASSIDGLMEKPKEKITEDAKIYNGISETNINELRDSVSDEIITDDKLIDTISKSDILSEHETETSCIQAKSKDNTKEITNSMSTLYNEIPESRFEDDIFIKPIDDIKHQCISVIPRIEITEAEESNFCDLSYLDNIVNYEYDKVVETSPIYENNTYEEKSDNTERKILDPISKNNFCDNSSLTNFDDFNINDVISTVLNDTSDEESDSEESVAIGYLPLEEEKDSLGFDINVNNEPEQGGRKVVECIEISESEDETDPISDTQITDIKIKSTLHCIDVEQSEGNSLKASQTDYFADKNAFLEKETSKNEQPLEHLAKSSAIDKLLITKENLKIEEASLSILKNNTSKEKYLLNFSDDEHTKESVMISVQQKSLEVGIMSFDFGNSEEGNKLLNSLENKQEYENSVVCKERKYSEEGGASEVRSMDSLNDSICGNEFDDSVRESTFGIEANTPVHVHENSVISLEMNNSKQLENNIYEILSSGNKKVIEQSKLYLETNGIREESISSCNNVKRKEEEKSVIYLGRNESEVESKPVLKNRTVEEEEEILQCLDNEIDTLVTKIKTVHKVNINTNELILSKNIVNNSVNGESRGKSVTSGSEGKSSSEVGTGSGLESKAECVGALSFTSPRTNSSSNSNSSSQHILKPGDTLRETSTTLGAAMADVDDSVETRMEVDEGVEDAEEVEVQEDAAHEKEEDDDVIGKYVDKEEKIDEEGLTFNKDDDDDDELPDFESKPKKKSSKSSKENGVDDDGKKKKKRRKAPDGKKKRSSKTGEEKENSSSRKATYQNDDILAKHVGPRVRSFDSNKIQKKFDKPKSEEPSRERTSEDILAKHVGPRVRSYDSNKMKKKFNRPRPASTQLSNDCKVCGKQVYQMEKIVAEKASWHKKCFTCTECNKQLTLETYQSHEGKLYCKPHFKELFQPKAVVEDETTQRQDRLKRRPRMIVLENNPDELPEDVVRATDKPDYGLEELSSANVKQKFSMFENKAKEKETRSVEPAHVRRSQSLMNKAARFLKGDDGDSEGEYGVENSYLGEYDEDDEDEEEEEEEEESEYEEIEVTDEEAEENEIKVNGTKENGLHEDENEDEEKDDEEKDDEERDEKDEEENEDGDEIKENGIDEEDSKPKKKVKKIIKVKKEKPKKEKKEKRSRRERPMSIAGGQASELKSQWENKNRRDRMREMRSKELSKFRQMLCAGKNTNLKEMFESGKIDNADSDDERTTRKEQIKIERAQAASRIKDRFEKGDAFKGADSDDDRNFTDERRECEEIFREAETARAARNRFRQIDSKVKGSGRDIMKSQSFANAPITNRRLSQEGGHEDTEIVRASDRHEDFDIDTTDLASRFKFFSNYEELEKQKIEEKRRSRSFRFTPPKEGVVKVDEEKEFMARMPKACMAINCPVCRSRGLEPEIGDFGITRDPNLIKATDKLEDNIDCARTKKLLDMFKKMEMQGSDDDEQGPPPPRRFTPPPDGEEYDSEEYSDEEYTDDEDYSDEEYSDEEEEDENGVRVPKYKDEVLEMLSARKAANLRAKFEKWENGRNEMNRGSDEEGEEAMPSIDTARNLRKMFENKATEQPVLVKQPKHKVNRFV